MVQATLNENSHYCMDMGCTTGITDLLLFKRLGSVLHVVFFEIKTKKGKLIPSQVEWEAEWYKCRLVGANTYYDVGYGFEECKLKLNTILENI